MDFSELLRHAKELGLGAAGKTLETLDAGIGAGVGFVKQTAGRVWLYASNETSGSYDDQQFDEKHYFLVPYRLAEVGYTLYSMRCLPDGVPPINDLPKRRMFHLPNEHAEATVEHLLLEDARQQVHDETRDGQQDPAAQKFIGNRLIDLADQVDRLDTKVFGGLLLLGGLVALVNPVAGAAVAAKALLPSLGLLFSKYGLKYAGESVNEVSLARQVQAAEKDVLNQFRGSETSSLVNPILAQLNHALDTEAFEFEPLLDVDFAEADFGQHDRTRFVNLTCRAVTNVYEDVLKDRSQWEAAALGPEDVRWLELIAQMAKG